MRAQNTCSPEYRKGGEAMSSLPFPSVRADVAPGLREAGSVRPRRSVVAAEGLPGAPRVAATGVAPRLIVADIRSPTFHMVHIDSSVREHQETTRVRTLTKGARFRCKDAGGRAPRARWDRILTPRAAATRVAGWSGDRASSARRRLRISRTRLGDLHHQL